MTGRLFDCTSPRSAEPIMPKTGPGTSKTQKLSLSYSDHSLFCFRWVCLCAWWVAKAGLSWPPEKLKNLGSFLHVAAWGVPAAQTVAALVRRDVDADELTGKDVTRRDNYLLQIVTEGK